MDEKILEDFKDFIKENIDEITAKELPLMKFVANFSKRELKLIDEYNDALTEKKRNYKIFNKAKKKAASKLLKEFWFNKLKES